MADLVIGISKTAVQLLADKVKSAIKEEAEQWKIVQRDLVFITGEFEMMQSFLDTASEEHVNNRIVRTWVRQVRDLSNDVEDNIDFVLNLDTTKSSWWLRLLPSFGRTAAELPVDEAVAETTLLRARVVDVSQRNIRYNLIVDSASKPIPAAMDPVKKTAASTSSFDVLINAVKKSGPLDLAGLVAREDYRDLHVVSVCGAEGDLVKVAIVRKMYSDARVHKEFQCRAWVKLVHPFNPHEFIRSLMTQFVTHSCQEQQGIAGLNALLRMQATQSDVDLINEFAQRVNTNRYLIVLEELSNMVQWDAIRSYLPDTKNGSRIVVLTHHPVVAGQCTGEPCRVSDIWQFSPGHSANVYYKEEYQHDRVHSFVKTEPYHSLFNYGLIGRETEMDELFEKTQQNRLISVWGMPGVGKSALVEAIYRKILKTSDYFDMHAWVNVSHPFNPTDFCRSLLIDLRLESTSSEGNFANTLGAKDPIKECHDNLRGRVGLFVIDGLQSNEDWDCIKSNFIQYGDSRSCIIITTSEESVAKHCAAASINGIYNVKGLHASATTALFQKSQIKITKNVSDTEKAFKECESYELIWAEESEPERAAEVAAYQILPKCGGIPRVIITSARYMASKPKDVFDQEMLRLRDNFMQEVVTNPEFDSLRGLLPWMHSYLDACPRHLKKCMLYVSIFPQDIILRRRRLIKRWIAEGYSKGTDSTSMEKHAEKIFDEVAALSIMQPVLKAGKEVGYRVNSLFRMYIMSRPVEETLFFPVEVSVLEKQGQGRLTTEGIGQHLAVGDDSWETDKVLFENLDFSRLRSLTVFNRYFSSFYVSDRMRVLRVLDLENAGRVDDSQFQQIGKLPSRLKFLSIRGQSGITRLPDSVGDLLQLQTLDIRDTSILTLPPFISRLRKLQYIRAGTTVAWTDDDIISSSDEEEESTPISRPRNLMSCLPKCLSRRGPAGSRSRSSGGVGLPRGIGRLKALQTLGAVDADTAIGDDVILHQITDGLPQLKKLQVYGISRKHSPKSLLIYLSHLESLTLHFVKKNHFVQWDHMYFIPYNVRSLRMYGHVEQLTSLISLGEKLVKVTLEMTTLFTAEVIEILGRIPNLETLRLRVKKDQDGELRFPIDLFSRLQVLEIASKSTLHITFDEGAMEKLERLKLYCLIGSSGTRVFGLQDLVSLKQVWILSSNDIDDALTKELQHQLDMHPKKPALKVKVTEEP